MVGGGLFGEECPARRWVAACGVVGWGRAILVIPVNLMMIVFTARECGLAVTTVTMPCDLLATAGCDEGHRVRVPRDSKVGTESN
jgi:hypothetical protein